MLEDDPDLTADLKIQMFGLMYVLYEHGIAEVHMGGLLRILGVPDDLSAKWDDRVLCLDENFAKYMSDLQSQQNTGQFLH
jgi:hypothetical protein